MNRRNLEKKKVCADISFQRMETTFVEISAISYRRRKLRKEVGWRRRRRRRRRRKKGYSTDNYPKIITTRKDYPRANTFIHDLDVFVPCEIRSLNTINLIILAVTSCGDQLRSSSLRFGEFSKNLNRRCSTFDEKLFTRILCSNFSIHPHR